MSKEVWMNDRLCCFADDTVRIEIGPQVISMKCTEENLMNGVTPPHYRLGGRDATGAMIDPEEHAKRLRAVGHEDAASEVDRNAALDRSLGRMPLKLGSEMRVVDWRAKHVPHMWKVYVWQESGVDSKGNPIMKFIKVDEIAGKDEALTRAHELAGGLN